MKALLLFILIFSTFVNPAFAKTDTARKPSSTAYARLIEKNRNNLEIFSAESNRSLKFMNYAEGVVFEINQMRRHGIEDYVDVAPGYATCKNPHFVEITAEDIQGARFSWSIKKMCDAFSSADKFEDKGRRSQLYIAATKEFLSTGDQNIEEALSLAKAAYENTQKKQLPAWSN